MFGDKISDRSRIYSPGKVSNDTFAAGTTSQTYPSYKVLNKYVLSDFTMEWEDANMTCWFNVLLVNYLGSIHSVKVM